MVPRELKKMTTDRYAKAAIRARRAATGESYSVAARAIAALPIPSGRADLDLLLGGGFDLSSVTLIVDGSDHSYPPFFSAVAKALMEPNRRVLVAAGVFGEKLSERILAVYHAQAGGLTADERSRIERHLSKNLIEIEEFSAESALELLNDSRGLGAILVESNYWEYYQAAPDGEGFERRLKELRQFTKEHSVPAVLYSWAPEGAETETFSAGSAADVILTLAGGSKTADDLKLPIGKTFGTQRISMLREQTVEAPRRVSVRVTSNPVATPFRF